MQSPRPLGLLLQVEHADLFGIAQRNRQNNLFVHLLPAVFNLSLEVRLPFNRIR
jgi:hypothetical protein